MYLIMRIVSLLREAKIKKEYPDAFVIDNAVIGFGMIGDMGIFWAVFLISQFLTGNLKFEPFAISRWTDIYQLFMALGILGFPLAGSFVCVFFALRSYTVFLRNEIIHHGFSGQTDRCPLEDITKILQMHRAGTKGPSVRIYINYQAKVSPQAIMDKEIQLNSNLHNYYKYFPAYLEWLKGMGIKVEEH